MAPAGSATSSCLFLRFVGQSIGAASFGAVLNLTLLHRRAGGGGLATICWTGSNAPS